MTLKRLMIIMGILIFLAGVGIAWLWQYAYSPEGRARVIIAQLKNDTSSLRGWLLQHHLVRPGYSENQGGGQGVWLNTNDSDGVVAAKDEIVKLGHNALPVVIEAMGDGNHDVRLMAIMACEGLPDPIEIPLLLRCLRWSMQLKHLPTASGPAFDDDDTIIQSECINSLAEIGPASLGAILHLIDDPRPVIRSCAACALGRFKDNRAADALIRRLSDSDSEVASGAAFSLGQIGDPKAIPALLKTFKESHDGSVRTSAAGALAWMGRDEGLNFLLAQVKSGDPGIRCSAASALGTTRIKGTLEPLLALLSDNDVNVRNAAVQSLSELHDPRAIPAIKNFLKAEPESHLRAYAAQILQKLEVAASPASHPGKP